MLVWGAVLFATIAALVLLAPREPVDREIAFDENALPDDLDAWLAAREQQFSDIVPGTEKRIVWAGEAGRQTDLAVIYIHGFSATSEEIRPVPDRVAGALGANLFFTRLAGHGRGGAAMAEPVAGDWIEDAAEALAVGRRIGREVVVIATSTGATAVALLAGDAYRMDRVKGLVFVSPNFRLSNPMAPLLTMPWARVWGPWVAGRELSFRALSAEQERFWTTRYPTVAAIPMGALVQAARRESYAGVTTPALFLISERDTVVSPAAAREVAARWGGRAVVVDMPPAEGDDSFGHIIAGDILSPGTTQRAVDTILAWLAGL